MAKDKYYMRAYRAKAISNASSRVGEPQGYPESMNGLFTQYGTVSLKPKDYAGYTRDEVEAFMSSLPYEVEVVFTPDGKVSGLISDWESDHVNMRVDELVSRMRDDRWGYTSFHNHPVFETADGNHTVQTPSVNDIDSWSTTLDWRYNTKHLPTSFAVRSQDGYSFRLEYEGQKSHAGLKEAYRLNDEQTRARVLAYVEKNGKPYERFAADQMAAHADRWLREHAGDYGFRYTSNWDIELVT